MQPFVLFENGAITNILCEPSALSGVKRVARTVAEDLFSVAGVKPDIVSDLGNCRNGCGYVIAATLGHSPLADEMAATEVLDVSGIAGKRECYQISLLNAPFKGSPEIKQALVIIGSDKRGTIYGLFKLSELCGVSPLIFWGDAAPAKKDRIHLSFEKDIVSKEPSVEYRGFFINDEWPAFGKWCTETYGDVNAKAYDKIFELVLRLKGNYMWPAMWNSSFWEDGPGLENALLADEYGVVVGTSHHEPLCRAGVEWQRQYKSYGENNAWSFVTNGDAITEFWKGGILRRKGLENIITIGMRGENDSLLMGKDATLQDNINVLKKAITVQNQLIRTHINPDLRAVPRMLAIYKEVEDFYFGAEGCDGLQGWEGIEDVILLFSDDNHGNLRAIPQPGNAAHNGGYGMYYHFDYHGGPVSYEWQNHTKLPKVWEQMTMAYENGIRAMWIVNVGDIKGNEYPLGFFMELAYDFDTWGTSNINSAAEYTERWIDTQFGDAVSDKQKTRINEILEGYTQWSAVRIPESLHPAVYQHNFHEYENTSVTINNIMADTEALRGELPDECLPAYESMIYFPVMAFFNALLLNLEAGANHMLAAQGALAANAYAAVTEQKIAMDGFYVNAFHKILNGKWNHMMDSAHMGFRSWDDNDWTYPVTHRISPIPGAKILVSFQGSDGCSLGRHWFDPKILCDAEMTRPDVNAIILNIDSRGDVDFNYTVSCDKHWLSFEPGCMGEQSTQWTTSPGCGVSDLKNHPRISITIRRENNDFTDIETAGVTIDFTFKNGDKKQAFVYVKCGNKDYSASPGRMGEQSGRIPEQEPKVPTRAAQWTTSHGACLETQGYICVHAGHYSEKSDIDGMGWRAVPRLGRMSDGIKAFPVTKNWTNEQERPFTQYKIIAAGSGEYAVTLYYSPRNPLTKGGAIRGCLSVNDEAPRCFDIVPSEYAYEGYYHAWNSSVLDNIRKAEITVFLNEGVNIIRYYATDPNVILETLVFYPKDKTIPATYLAPPESCRILGKCIEGTSIN
jgi:hypothetical protein